MRKLTSFILFLALSGCCRTQPLPYPATREQSWKQGISFESTPLFSPPPTVIALEGEEKTLCSLIDYALSHNPKTEKSWNNTKASLADVGIARSQCYPDVNFSAQIGRSIQSGSEVSIDASGGDSGEIDSFGSAFGFFGTETFLNGEIFVNWLLFDFGGRSQTIVATQKALVASNWMHNMVIQEVIRDVITTYYIVLETVAEVEAKVADLENYQEIYKAALLQMEAGLNTVVDLYQAESNVKQAELRLERARGDLVKSKGDLAQALGFSVLSEVALPRLPESVPVVSVEEQMTHLLTIAKTYRPGLSQQFALYESKKAESRAIISDAAPNVTMFLDFNRAKSLTSPYTSSSSDLYALSLNWEMFNGFRTRYRWLKSKNEEKIIYAEWKKTEAEIENEVVKALSDWDVAKVNIETAKSFLSSSEEAFKAALKKYQAGVGTILDVLSTQSTLSDARSESIASRGQWFISLANLSYATGTLWEGQCRTDCGKK